MRTGDVTRDLRFPRSALFFCSYWILWRALVATAHPRSSVRCRREALGRSLKSKRGLQTRRNRRAEAALLAARKSSPARIEVIRAEKRAWHGFHCACCQTMVGACRAIRAAIRAPGWRQEKRLWLLLAQVEFEWQGTAERLSLFLSTARQRGVAGSQWRARPPGAPGRRDTTPRRYSSLTTFASLFFAPAVVRLGCEAFTLRRRQRTPECAGPSTVNVPRSAPVVPVMLLAGRQLGPVVCFGWPGWAFRNTAKLWQLAMGHF